MNRVQVGQNATIESGTTLGHAFDRFGEPTVIGDDATIRTGTVIYASTTIGDRLRTGHGALVRERTELGDAVLVGTSATIDGHSDVGSNVSIQTGGYVPANSSIGDQVFIGPNAVLTNDPTPVRGGETDSMAGPILQDGVTVGANATILPEIVVGEDAFIAAGAVVTADVPPRTLAIGVPAEHRELPRDLQPRNMIQ